MRLLVIAAVLLCAGCVSSKERAAAADAECKSWGAQPGTDRYFKCRAYLRETQAAQARAAGAAVAAGLQAQSNAYYARSQQPRTCFVNGQYITCY